MRYNIFVIISRNNQIMQDISKPDDVCPCILHNSKIIAPPGVSRLIGYHCLTIVLIMDWMIW